MRCRWGGVVAALISTAGCSTGDSAPKGARALTASDFVAPAQGGQSAGTVGNPTLGRQRSGADSTRRETSTQSASGGMSDVVVLTGPPPNRPSATNGGGAAGPVRPDAPGPMALTSGDDAGAVALERVTEPAEPAAQAYEANDAKAAGARERKLLVDRLVGQINGRPVYAYEFFAPMDERLRREASRMPTRDFLAFAKKEIDGALWDKLRDDLLLAEFQSAMTPEQRMGVFAFVEQVRADLISGNLGSESLANNRLREAEGMGLEEKVTDITQRRLILEQLRRAIGNRVNVSYWDVRQYYEQNIDKFVPPPAARFRIIRAPRAEASRVERIESAIAAGEPFEEIARRESTWRPDEGNTQVVTLESRDYASNTFFGPAPLNDAARALKPGEATARIEFGSDAWWIRLDAIDQPPGKSLYEAQGEIERRLRAERQREEEIRYFEQLFRRGSFSDIKSMSAQLLEFAAERYLVQRSFSEQGSDGGSPSGSDR